jgi:hypothetical protein
MLESRYVGVSSIPLIRRVDPETAQDKNADDPFRSTGGKIIPTLSEPIKGGPGSGLSLYFVVYPAKEIAEKPQLVLEFFKGGEKIGQPALELPAPEESGRIPYVAGIPAEGFQPGEYEVRVIARQGSSRAEERMDFTIVP